MVVGWGYILCNIKTFPLSLLFNLPISLCSLLVFFFLLVFCFLFFFFAPLYGERERETMGARITHSRRLPFLFLHRLLLWPPSFPLPPSLSLSLSILSSLSSLPYSLAAAVPPTRRCDCVMTMATTCHWSSFGRPVPNWTHVSVANALLSHLNFIPFSIFFFFIHVVVIRPVTFCRLSLLVSAPNEIVFTFSDSSSSGGRVIRPLSLFCSSNPSVFLPLHSIRINSPPPPPVYYQT